LKKFVYFSLLVFLISSFLYVRYLKGEVKKDDVSAERKNYIGVKYEVGKGETFVQILRKSHLKNDVIDSIINSFSKIYSPKKIDVDDQVFIFTDEDFNFRRLEYKNDPSKTYVVEYTSKYNSYIINNRSTVSIEFIEGEVDDNIINAIKAKGENEKLALKFTKIFDWRIDVFSEVKKGDKFTILFEKEYIDGEFYKYGDIIYASFENDKNLYEGFLYDDGNGKIYYDQNGNSLEGTFLKAPLATYYRISSTFTSKRYHPILKRYIPHYAVDYSAPKKTPVYAASDGYIIYVGYNYIGGKTVRIDHENGYNSEYCHLFSYAKDIKVGKFVKQGEVIGYVGKSGYATGYHLHFAVKKNGKFINPLKIKNEENVTIDPSKLNDYKIYVDNIRTLVLGIKSFKNFPSMFSKSDFIFKYADTFGKSPNI